MIGLTRRTGEHCRLDPDLIQRVEAHPDTVVFLIDGAEHNVVETVDQIVRRIREDRATVIAACYRLDRGEDPDPLGRHHCPPRRHEEIAAEAHRPVAIPIRLP